VIAEPDTLYALGKFRAAIWVLACGPGDVRSRLLGAFESISPVSASDLPEDIRVDYQWIRSTLSRYEPNDTERRLGFGRLEATLRLIRNSTGVKIAERIVEIEAKLADRVMEHRTGAGP